MKSFKVFLPAFLFFGFSLTYAANPLGGLPAEEGSHLASIRALGDNQWLDLGSPSSDPVWGNARGRSWGGDGFILIPHLRGAILTGEGRHAYVKPDGYGMDDYWFYDINRHKWICLYPGTDVNGFNSRVASGDISVDSLGHAVNSSGELLPGHNYIHAWGYLTYDPHRRLFTSIPSNGYGAYYFPGWTTVETGVTALKAAGLNKHGSSYTPWYYNVDQGRFERQRSTNASNIKGSDYGQFEYLTKHRKYFYGTRGGVFYFDPATNTYSSVQASGPKPTSYDFGGYYDETRDRVYFTKSSGNSHIFDVATETWLPMSSSGSPGNLGTNSGNMNYDSVNDVGIGLAFEDKKGAVYSPDSDSWSGTFSIPVPSGQTHGTFYDPFLNVHFVFTAGDSRDDASIWVYRYKGASSVEEGKSARYGVRGSRLEVSPNPFKGVVSFQLPVVRPQKTEIRIFGSNGRLVKKLTTDNLQLKTQWKPGNIPSGIYIVKVQYGNQTQLQKLIYQR